MQGKGGRVALLGGLYLVQGVVHGFTLGVLIPSLAAAGASVQAQTGVLALAGLPWVLKLPVAAALDRWRLRPGRVAAAALLGMAVVVALLAWIGPSPGRIATLSTLVLLLNALLASEDVAADAIALDHIDVGDRGLANGAMRGGHALGAALLGSMALGAVAARSTLSGALWSLVALLLVATAAVAAASRGLPAASSRDGGRSGSPPGSRTTQVVGLLRRPSTWVVAAFAGVVLTADVVTGALTGEFLVNHLHWPLERVSGTLGLTVLAGQVLGYGVAALVVDRLGHARATAWGCWSLGALWVGFGVVPGAWNSVAFMLGFVVVQLIATALMMVGLHAWLMDRVEPSIRATHFAVLTSLLNLPRAWATVLAPALLGALAFEGLYIASGAFQISVGFVLLLVARRVAALRVHEP